MPSLLGTVGTEKRQLHSSRIPTPRCRHCGVHVAHQDSDTDGNCAASYPPFVNSANEQQRWDLAARIAEELFGDLDPAATWMATRSLYSSEIPTNGEEGSEDYD